MTDEPKKSKKPLAILAVALLLCAVVAAVLILKSRHPNAAPTAALRLDSIDQTNRIAMVSDGGSQDPDGTIRNWRIAWGDGKEENLPSIPQKAAHTYASEGDYRISLWCVDNLGATSSPPAMTNITFDLLMRQKAQEVAQAESKREADRLKEEQARKEAERLDQEQKKMELAAQKAREQQEQEAKRKAEAELARQKAKEAAEAPQPLPPAPLAAALTDDSSSRRVIYTPAGFSLGEYEISKEKAEGMGKDGKLLVVLAIRCVNFPETPIPTFHWQIDGKGARIQASRIRASLSTGEHEVSALRMSDADSPSTEIKADVTVKANGECVVVPRK